MFETLMTTIKSKVVSSEFRSATVSRMRSLFEMMSRNAQHTNQDEISVDGGAGEQAPAAAAQSSATVADVFASMMSSARAPAAGAAFAAPAERSGSMPPEMPIWKSIQCIRQCGRCNAPWRACRIRMPRCFRCRSKP